MTEEKEKDFVTICVACNQGVTRDELKYVSGRVFHPECYEKHGKNFLVLNQDLMNRSARTKIELVQLKNLKMRTGGSRISSPKPKKKASKRKTARKSKRKTSRTKRRKVSKKKRTSRRKTSRRTAPKRRKASRSKARRRPTRKAKRRTAKRKSRRRR